MRRRNRLKELTPDEVSRSSRLCATLESLAKERGAAGGTLNCHSGSCLRNLEIGITACYSLGIQNSQGRPFTCTGDLPTAIAMLILKNLAGVSMYTEVQVIDEERRGVVIANNGEGEGGMRRDGCRPIVRGNCNFKGPHGRGAAFAYPLRTGRATLVSFTPSPQGARPFRLIVAEGRILQATLPGVGGLAGFFRFSHTDVSEGYTRWLEAGAVHHAATCTGHWGRELGDIADLLNLQFVKI